MWWRRTDVCVSYESEPPASCAPFAWPPRAVRSVPQGKHASGETKDTHETHGDKVEEGERGL